jgi:hypothetical protein
MRAETPRRAAAGIAGGARTFARNPATVVPLIAWLTSAAYVWSRLDRDWFPWDEGTLAEPADRILRGELPHRDFVDAYTGALSYIHAVAFLVFGRELTSLRLVLFAAFLAWVPSLYYVCLRFLHPVEAAAVSLVAVVWSVPNYTASMPSWYCTFLATFGVAALFRHLETRRRRWLFTAGLCGGLSITVKVVGIYFVAAAIVYFVFKASSDPYEHPEEPGPRRRWLSTAVGMFSIAMAGGVAFVLRQRLGPGEVVNFLAPVLALAAFAYLSSRRGEHRDAPATLRPLLRLASPFLLGVLLPVAVFVAPYVALGALGDLASGVWPVKRIQFASLSPPNILLLFAVVVFVPVIWVPKGLRDMRDIERTVPIIVLAVAGLVVSRNLVIYSIVWQSLRAVVPVLTVGGLIAVSRRWQTAPDPAAAQRVVLLLAVAAMCSLVQFPFAAPIYFAYVAPLVIIAAAALAVFAGLMPRPVLWTVIAFYLLFGVVSLNAGGVSDVGSRAGHADLTHTLRMPRGGLDVSRYRQHEYDRLISLVRRHADGSKYIYATPDSPEVYFLSGFENPTKTLFEFLDVHPSPARRLVGILIRRTVNVVVINQIPPLSGPTPPWLRHALTARYPHTAMAGQFLVRWRN